MWLGQPAENGRWEPRKVRCTERLLESPSGLHEWAHRDEGQSSDPSQGMEQTLLIRMHQTGSLLPSVTVIRKKQPFGVTCNGK
eukprot:1142131-Pelagomonas_calceolata.AAC.3